MLEIHYNNPEEKSGVKDNSGMRFWYIDGVREHDAAIMELGVEYTDKMALPPKQLAFPISGYCISECTKLSVPEEGINIFAGQLHTHIRGARGSFDKKFF